MDARRLLIFREVARAGSISAAARALGWTQPAVSQHLRALERSVGAALLLRGAGGVELTEPGRVLLARADAVAAQLHMATEEMAELTALRRGRVRLAAYPSAAATLVPAVLARLRTAHPDIDVELTEAEPPEALALLAAGDVDVALTFSYGPEPETAPGQRRLPLGEEPVLLVLPEEHPLVASTDTDGTFGTDGTGETEGTGGSGGTAAAGPGLARLAEEDWVVGCERCRAHTLQRCDEAGFRPRVRHVSDDYVVVQNLVALGLGVTLLPRSALAAYRHPRVRTLPGYGSRRLAAVLRDGADSVPATASLLRELVRLA